MMYHKVRIRSLRRMSVGVGLLAFLRLWTTTAFVVSVLVDDSRRWTSAPGTASGRCLSSTGKRSLPVRQDQQPKSPLFATNQHSTDEIGIGIDLGTTFSAVAYLEDGVPTIVPIDGERTMPSVVRFCLDEDGETGVVVGRRACASLDAYRNVKRVIGTGGKIPRDVAAVVPYVRVNPNGKTYKKDSLLNQIDDASMHPTLLVNASNPSESFAPSIVSSYVIQRLKEVVVDHTGRSVTRAVIGVPAYFNDAQREATIAAARNAGIGKVKLLREPEAAALAYKRKDPSSTADADDDDADELVLVFDLGGGTFDVSMLVVGGGITEVLCTSGNTQLGGSDFDGRIAQHFVEVIREQGGGSYSAREWSRKAQNAVLLAAECVRIHLSNNRAASLALPISAKAWEEMLDPRLVLLPKRLDDEESGSSNSTHLFIELSRRTVENLCREEFQSLLRPIREVAIMAGALLPGDTSPTIVDAALELEDAMSNEYEDFFPAEEVAPMPRGQDEVLQAKKSQQRGRKKARDIAKQERKFRTEKRKLSTGDLESVKVRDGISGRPISRVVLVGGATRMPAIGKLLAALTGVTPQKTVNPDEAVALGCAVQVGVLDGDDQFGKVLNPMQAAILRAMAEQASSQQFDDDD